jgi:ketosteroid isomerase-like protein
MSHENVEVVRRFYQSWSKQDLAGVLDCTHAEFQFDWVYRGLSEVQRFLEEWLETWDSYDARLDDLLDAGDRVVAFWSQRMIGRGSRVPVEFDSAQVWIIRDGVVTRINNYSDRAEALEAVGLKE